MYNIGAHNCKMTILLKLANTHSATQTGVCHEASKSAFVISIVENQIIHVLKS